ncbi:MAG: hypothetical protein NTZ74_11635 [Chloroflexi bacterium]|nr:hypothetical protein [Chloroflexota bacterium]
METPNPPIQAYRFHFIKDHFLAWVILLPFGLICRAIPLVLFFGLKVPKNTPDWFPLFAFMLLGLPAYLVGWVFVYSLMEGIYTKVTIAENSISIMLPCSAGG